MAKTIMQKRTIRYAHVAKDFTYADFVKNNGIATLKDALKADTTFKANMTDALKADSDFKTATKGDSVTVSKTETAYASSTSGTTPPTTGWQTSIPAVAAGSYLWTRTTTTFSDGKQAVSYVCARQGVNGSTPKYSDFGTQLVSDLKANATFKADFCTALKADVGFKEDIKEALKDDDDFVESTKAVDFDTDSGILKVHTPDGGYVNINFKTATYAACTKQMCQMPVAFGKAT